MRYIPVESLLAVMLLVTACPLLATAEVDPGVGQSQMKFGYSAEWGRRIHASENEHGGGAIDGGGGNISESGQLLDQDGREGLTKLEIQPLRDVVNISNGTRLQKLEQALPGFMKWLSAAYSLPWYLDSKPFNPQICQNATLHVKKTLSLPVRICGVFTLKILGMIQP